MNDLVSIIITTFQRFEMCKKAILSADYQTYENLEIVVVEDGSRSGIKEWMEARSFKHPARYIANQTNIGLAASRNRGLKESRGSLVCFLDDDDSWEREKITRQVDHFESVKLQTPNLAGVQCRLRVLNLDGTQISELSPRNFGVLKDSIIKCGIGTLSSTTLFVKAALEKVGTFDETMASSIDHDIWMSLAVNGFAISSVPEVLVNTISDSAHPSMMTCSRNRLTGVKQFINKWRSAFEAWLGADQARRFLGHYKATVVARFAAAKLFEGNVREFFLAFNEFRGVGLTSSAKGIFALMRIIAGRIKHALFSRRKSCCSNL